MMSDDRIATIVAAIIKFSVNPSSRYDGKSQKPNWTWARD